MKNVNWDGVQEATEYSRLAPGGYICRITKATDVPDKEYLKLEYNIAEGEFKDYFKQLNESKNFWGGNFVRSYKESALSFFKAFKTAVEGSNSGYKFINDENTLVGKLVGLVLGEEEYEANDGSTKNRLYVDQVRNVESIKKKDFKIPELKTLKPKSGKASVPGDGFMNIPDGLGEDMPF